MIAIVGRSNVGKSTLFNKLIEERKALTSNEAGTTRDRNIALCTWRGRTFEIVDTGGIDVPNNPSLEDDIIKQVEYALDAAKAAILVVDSGVGITDADRQAMRMLQKKKVPFVVAANKADNLVMKQQAEAMKIPSNVPRFAVSAINGTGTGELLDGVFDMLPKTAFIKPEKSIRVSFVGKPNVGKSSLLNALAGYERVIAHNEAHTTREPQSLFIHYHKQLLEIVDTAGIRRKARVAVDDQAGGQLERGSVSRSITMLRASDIALFVIDANEVLTKQDQTLGSLVARAGCGVVLVVNKWDLITKDSQEMVRYEKKLRAELPMLYWAPIIFTSALEKTRVQQLLETCVKVASEREKHLDTEELTTFLKSVTTIKLPSRGKGTMHPKLYAMEQIETAPPLFRITMNDPSILHISYPRFVEKKLRERYGFEGVPVKIRMEKALRKPLQ